MPRINLLKTKYRLNDLSLYILGTMRVQRITQSEMAAALDMTQSNFSQKAKAATFTARDLIIIFDKLGTPEDKIGSLLKGDHNGRH